MVDILSDGRFTIGLGRAMAREFEAFGADLERR
jgi:alkanesulfonate monooxygenase SsuD/methylene tetrahydromethanopterin reductase-like flavin-dependent oxidoreductase (luciferase family)